MSKRRTRPLYSSSAEECRQRGFKVGDRLVGDEGYGPTVIRITAIGESELLARTLCHNGQPSRSNYETLWGLDCRDWELVAPPETKEV